MFFSPYAAKVNIALQLSSELPLRPHTITQRLGGLPNATTTALRALERDGVAQSVIRQGHVEWEPARGLVYGELARRIAIVDFGRMLSDALVDDGASIMAAFIFGSVATNTATSASDLDIFIVGRLDERKAHRVIASFEAWIGREIDVIIRSAEETRADLTAGDPYARAGMAGVRVHGDWSVE